MPRLLVVVVLLLAVACAPAALAPDPVPPSQADQPLLRIDWHGGLCPDGECRSSLVVLSDGRVRDARGESPTEWRVEPAAFSRLVGAVGAADFVAIAATPFEGVCPVAFDGQEAVYTFFTTTPPTRVASCEVAIDETDPLWIELNEALFAY